MVNFGSYAAVSAACALGVVYHAFATRRQFYPVMLYLTRSKISLMFMLNMGFVIMCAFWQLVNMLFLGPLRETEVERLNEQCWREVMEILFAMTVFRDEFNLYFLFLITVLLFIKAFHWLVQKRVEYIETTPSVPRLSHVRLCTFMALLLTLDCLFFHRSFSHLLNTREASVSLFFAFEYVILATTTIATFIKYCLHVGDTFMEGRFNSKSVCIFYLELVQDLLHLSLYLVFFLAIFMHYGLPLHLVRELYETVRNFKNRISDFIRYRKLTSNMDERFADATAEEIRRDATCIICREDMVAAKKISCGHLFHVHCLRSWLERQHTCPTCRAPVLPSESEPPTDIVEEPFGDEAQAEEGPGDFFPIDDDRGEVETSAQADRVVNETDWPQLHAAATMAAANYGPSFVYPALTWYPVSVPFLPRTPWAQEMNPFVDLANGGDVDRLSRRGNLGQDALLSTTTEDSPNDHLQRWIRMHAISQTATILSQLQDNAMRQQQQPRFVPSTLPPYFQPPPSSTTTLDRGAEDGQGPDLRPPIVANLTVSRDAQLTYLKGVSEILRRQLQSNLELEHQMSLRGERTLPAQGVTGNMAAVEASTHQNVDDVLAEETSSYSEE